MTQELTRDEVERVVEQVKTYGRDTVGFSCAVLAILAHDQAQRERMAKYQQRLEIDHVFDMDGNRVEIPEGERDKQIDGISCRDCTIQLQNEELKRKADHIQSLEDSIKALQHALSNYPRPFPYSSQDDSGSGQ